MGTQDRRVPSLFLVSLNLVIVAVLLIAALVNRQRDFALLCLLVLGLVAGTKAWARYSLSAIECRVRVNRTKVFPGEEVTVKTYVENRKWFPLGLFVTAPVTGPVRSSSTGTVLSGETGLLWYERARFQWELPVEVRGLYRLGPLRAGSGDLFGFFLNEKEVEGQVEVIVYPRLVPLKYFPLPKREFFGIPGTESPVKDPVYILGTTDYQHGRPARYIHWKATARHHRLQEKVFEPTAQEKVLLVLEVDQFAARGANEEFERTLEVVASIAVRLERQGCAIGFVTNGALAGEVSPLCAVTRNQKQLPTILEALARVRMEPGGDLIDTMRRGLNLPWGTTCLYFTLEEAGPALFAREYFMGRRTPVMLFVCRPSPPAGGRAMTAGGTVHNLNDIVVRELKGR